MMSETVWVWLMVRFSGFHSPNFILQNGPTLGSIPWRMLQQYCCCATKLSPTCIFPPKLWPTRAISAGFYKAVNIKPNSTLAKTLVADGQRWTLMGIAFGRIRILRIGLQHTLIHSSRRTKASLKLWKHGHSSLVCASASSPTFIL